MGRPDLAMTVFKLAILVDRRRERVERTFLPEVKIVKKTMALRPCTVSTFVCDKPPSGASKIGRNRKGGI